MYAQLDIFMYIKAYSEYMAYSGIFGTVDIFSQFQAHYSGITKQQFMLIVNLIWANSDIFGTLAYLDILCFTPIETYSARWNMSLSNILCKTKKISNLEPKMSYVCNFGL